MTGYEFFAHYEAAQEVGGDYYDFIPLGSRLATAVGDVAGKGVAAALLMAKVSSDARFCLLTEPEPAQAVTKLNDLIQQAQARAAGILRENRQLLETLRDLLLEKKTLDAKALGAMAPAKPEKAPRKKKAPV